VAIINIASSACFASFWVTLTFLLGGSPYYYSTYAHVFWLFTTRTWDHFQSQNRSLWSRWHARRARCTFLGTSHWYGGPLVRNFDSHQLAPGFPSCADCCRWNQCCSCRHRMLCAWCRASGPTSVYDHSGPEVHYFFFPVKETAADVQ